MQIKLIKPADWKDFKKIRLDSLKNDPESFGSNYNNTKTKPDRYWKNKLKDSNNLIFIAYDNKTPVGLVRITLNDKEIPKNNAYLGSLYVKKEYRSKGISKKLIYQTEQYLKTNSEVNGIYLEVYTFLANVVYLYKSIGYSIVKEQVTEQRKEYLMYKKLN